CSEPPPPPPPPPNRGGGGKKKPPPPPPAPPGGAGVFSPPRGPPPPPRPRSRRGGGAPAFCGGRAIFRLPPPRRGGAGRGADRHPAAAVVRTVSLERFGGQAAQHPGELPPADLEQRQRVLQRLLMRVQPVHVSGFVGVEQGRVVLGEHALHAVDADGVAVGQ